jgi:hypothetical protein
MVVYWPGSLTAASIDGFSKADANVAARVVGSTTDGIEDILPMKT